MEAEDEVADPKAHGQQTGKYIKINNKVRISKEAKLRRHLLASGVFGDQNWTVAVLLLCVLLGMQGQGREQAIEGWKGK